MDARVTMQDVARVAGVSAKTVSNVLRGADGASASTRERVLAAVQDLGYRLNSGAAALRSGRRGAVALAIPTLQQPMYADLATHLMREAGDMRVVLELTGGEHSSEIALAEGSWKRQCDALIMLPRSLDPLHDLQTAHGVVLIADAAPAHLPRATCSAHAQTLLVAGHIRELQRRHVAILGVREPADTWTDTCATTLRDLGFSIPPQAVVRLSEADGVRGGVEAVSRLLYTGAKVDALVCHNDAIAAGAMVTLQRRGARLPDDVVVIGRGDTETAAFASPGLTSVSCGAPQLAQELVSLLTAVIEDPEAPARAVEVAPHLTIRDSSRRPGTSPRHLPSTEGAS